MGVATQIFFLVVQHEVIEANVHRGPLSDRFSTYLVLYLAYTVLWTWLFVVYFWRKPKASASQG